MQLQSSSGAGFVDVGPAIVQQLRDALGVEAAWSVDAPRGFRWWPGGSVCVSVTAAPVRRDCGFDIVAVRAETEVLVDVQSSRAVDRALAHVNGGSTLTGAVLDDAGAIVAVSGMYLHAETADWGAMLLAHAAVVQMACAPELERLLGPHIGGRAPHAVHPERGMRLEPSPMESGVLALAAASRERGRVPEPELAALPAALEQVAVAHYTEPGAALVEIPYRGTEPAWIDWCREDGFDPVGTAVVDDWPAHRAPPETALLIIDLMCHHPALGPGCLLLLVLPEESHDAARATRLARAERDRFARCHGLGGWFDRRGQVAHVAFVPSAAFAEGLLVPLVWNEVVRTRFALYELCDEDEPGSARASPADGAPQA